TLLPLRRAASRLARGTEHSWPDGHQRRARLSPDADAGRGRRRSDFPAGSGSGLRRAGGRERPLSPLDAHRVDASLREEAATHAGVSAVCASGSRRSRDSLEVMRESSAAGSRSVTKEDRVRMTRGLATTIAWSSLVLLGLTGCAGSDRISNAIYDGLQ